jgi:hypothetical protein
MREKCKGVNEWSLISSLKTGLASKYFYPGLKNVNVEGSQKWAKYKYFSNSNSFSE